MLLDHYILTFKYNENITCNFIGYDIVPKDTPIYTYQYN